MKIVKTLADSAGCERINDELREMIVAREPIRKLKEAAKRSGMRTMREAALEAVSNGLTTLQEINRVTFIS